MSILILGLFTWSAVSITPTCIAESEKAFHQSISPTAVFLHAPVFYSKTPFVVGLHVERVDCYTLCNDLNVSRIKHEKLKGEREVCQSDATLNPTEYLHPDLCTVSNAQIQGKS